MRIRKAVLPVAGLGTRVLPATKAIPKELLPLVDKPTLQYIVEEAVEAGIEEIILVTSRSKRAIEDHFDSFPELEQTLERKGKTKELKAVRRPQELAKYVVVRQSEPLGLGHAILCAREAVGDEPFAVLLGDELTPCLPKMLEVYEKYQASVLSLFHVEREKIPSYGIASVKEREPNVYQVKDLVEKPPIEEAPSDLAVAGRYIVTPDIFPILEHTKPGRGGEIQFTDALLEQAHTGHCYGILHTGQRLDMGTPLGLLTAAIEIGLSHPEIGSELREYLKNIINAQQ